MPALEATWSEAIGSPARVLLCFDSERDAQRPTEARLSGKISAPALPYLSYDAHRFRLRQTAFKRRGWADAARATRAMLRRFAAWPSGIRTRARSARRPAVPSVSAAGSSCRGP